MKRIIALVTGVILLLSMLAACGQSESIDQAYESESTDQTHENEAYEHTPIVVVTTAFPQFDFVRQIAGDRVELTMLLSPGAESHSFEPTPRDMITMYGADLFIYVGGDGEVWVDPVLASIGREDMRRVRLIDLVDTVYQELVEGMEEGHHHHHHGHSHDHDHDHDHDSHDHHHDDYDHDHHDHDHHHGDHDHDHNDHDHHHDDHDHDHHGHDHHHEPHLDEHVWTSPRNAIIIVQALTDILAEMDPHNAEYFRANAMAYIQDLEALDQNFADVVADGVRQTVVFGDRFPFRYFTDAYNLTYFAAFPGCANDTYASPATVAFLIERVRDEEIPVIFTIEFSQGLIANVIAEATGARIMELHSVHNVSQADFNAGVTYLELMTRNVEVLREALS